MPIYFVQKNINFLKLLPSFGVAGQINKPLSLISPPPKKKLLCLLKWPIQKIGFQKKWSGLPGQKISIYLMAHLCKLHQGLSRKGKGKVFRKITNIKTSPSFLSEYSIWVKFWTRGSSFDIDHRLG